MTALFLRFSFALHFELATVRSETQEVVVFLDTSLLHIFGLENKSWYVIIIFGINSNNSRV